MRDILVYVDEGVGPRSAKLLIKSLGIASIQKNYSIKRVDRHTISDQLNQDSSALLIMPGGRDIYYHEALIGLPNANIRSFVERGGRYLGICAGGYYGCSYIEFERGGSLDVHGKRELAFFPGVAKGPAYGNGYFSYEDERGCRIALLEWLGQDTNLKLKSAASYFNGGCLFENAHDYENTEVLACYQDIEGSPAAIIQCHVGKGIAILSGVHPEYSTHNLRGTKDPYLLDQLPHLEKIEESRHHVFQNLLFRLINTQ